MKISFIGGGNMAEAIIASLLATRKFSPHELNVCDISAERRRILQKRYGVNVYSRNNMAEVANIIFLSVKPQNIAEVIGEIAADITKEQLVVSIAAGKTTSALEAMLPPQTRVVRVMPNLPGMVMHGMSVFCLGSSAKAADRRIVQGILISFGKVLELPEDKFDAVTALSGSGPAFFAYLLDCMVEAGVQEGLSREDALLMAEQTMMGTAQYLLERNVDPRDLIKTVSSAKGTTEAGMKALSERGTVAGVISRTIKAAAMRSNELSR